LTVGFIGLGEAGSAYALGLIENGAAVRGYDIMLSDPSKSARFQPLAEAGVFLAGSAGEMVEGCDIVIAVTASHVAEVTAQSLKPYLKPGQVYLELNSATPMLKEKIRETLVGIDVVDGASMGALSAKKHKTLIYVSGARGMETAEKLNAFGLHVQCVSETFGHASGIKMVRSIFFKGVEAVLMESMHAAYRLGIQDTVWNSITGSFAETPADQLLAAMIKTNVKDSRRRSDEASGALELLEGLNLDSTMTVATAEKLMYLANLGLKEKFDGNIADSMEAVLQELP